MKNIDLIGNTAKGTWHKIYEDDLVLVKIGTAIFCDVKLPSYVITLKKFNICVTLHKTEGSGTLPEVLEGQGLRIRTWVFKNVFRAAVVNRIDCEDFIGYLESIIAEEPIAEEPRLLEADDT